MLRVEDAVEVVLAQTEPLESVRIEAYEADGYVLAEPVVSIEPLPPFRASIMDGYAVVAADGVGTFPVVERIAAGDMPMSALQPGQVSYITTGSPVPDGADAVVKIEDTSAVEKSENSITEAEVNILKDAERPEFHRANLAWDIKQHKFLATSTGRQISSRLLSCRNANTLLCLPTGSEVRDGDAIPALVLDVSFGNVAGIAAELLKGNSIITSTPTPENHQLDAPKKVFRAGLLTISDRVSAGTSKDLSGPTMADVLQQIRKVQVNVVTTKVVADDTKQIQAIVKEWSDLDMVDLILTSGGTGFSPRDVTPEAIKSVLDKEIPGFPIAMLESSLKITAKAVLSRPVAGIRKNTLIVTLPGKPKAVVENFSAIAEVLPHALHLVRDIPHEHHRANPSTLYT
ncbi:hypothetical protein PHYBOEH_011345 [Phytophthora boehmeriae]|uniref:MoaB/Mog domain-containing protein n=1 Tax=Phytophthora boehmeriae TaxID=109152 RepID=A0A8T1VHF4_9STRA|nr:hypothetical protein PHYBOEH_011345 [Phytophthora boehmeriae]